MGACLFVLHHIPLTGVYFSVGQIHLSIGGCIRFHRKSLSFSNGQVSFPRIPHAPMGIRRVREMAETSTPVELWRSHEAPSPCPSTALSGCQGHGCRWPCNAGKNPLELASWGHKFRRGSAPDPVLSFSCLTKGTGLPLSGNNIVFFELFSGASRAAVFRFSSSLAVWHDAQGIAAIGPGGTSRPSARSAGRHPVGFRVILVPGGDRGRLGCPAGSPRCILGGYQIPRTE